VTLFDRLAQRAVSEEEKSTSRRTFLKRTGKIGAVLATVIAGVAQASPAAATHRVGCCNLAYNTSCPCRGCCKSCNNKWAWYCVTSGGQAWECGECYATNGCSGCSWAYPGLSHA
jgi:hypothetical protein